MKTKVLLVDDEKLERVLIRKGYDWEENGFEIIGEASSGEEALEFFDWREPDIVLTDINMPYMDGLALTAKIKERAPKCRVIIVTGYREFEYARKALQLGVKDFILKPVNIHDIATLVEGIKEEMRQEEGLHEEYTKLKETVLMNQDVVLESFLQRLVENHMEEEEALRKIQLYGYEPLLKQCICVNIKPHLNQNDAEVGTLTYSKKILGLLQNNHDSNMIAFVHYLCNIILYFYGDGIHQAQERAEEIKNQINAQLGIEAVIGISQENQGFEGIARAYRQAEKAISASVILGRNSCITYEEYARIKKENQGNTEIDWQDFVFNVENCLSENVEKNINDFTDAMKRAGVTNRDYLKLMAMNMLSKASTVLSKHGKSLGQLVGEETLYEEVSKIETVEEMNICLSNIIKKILVFSDGIRTKRSNKLVDQTLEYINGHLCEQTLTLKSIASQVYVNESYLSRVFKQELGEGLIEYITRKRIEHSIVLLNTTALKVYEIAEKVGFADAHYFSICFKKQMGVTIKEYKKPKF